MPPAHSAVFDLIERFETMTSADEVWADFLAFAGRSGLRFGILSEVPGVNETIDDVRVCMTWPEEWSQRYVQRDYMHNDPAVLHAAQSSGPYTWSEALQSGSYSKAQIRIVHEGSEFGMTEGFVIPILSFTGGPGGVALSGYKVELPVRARAELQFAGIYAHAKARSLRPRRSKSSQSPGLSPRERECLHWVAAGKSDWAIAAILSISHSTAHQMVEQAKRKLGVPTRVQAVVEAIRRGIIIP